MDGTAAFVVFGALIIILVALYVWVVALLHLTHKRLDAGTSSVPLGLIWVSLIPGIGALAGAFWNAFLLWRLRTRLTDGKAPLITGIVYAALGWFSVGLAMLTRNPAVACFAALCLAFLLINLLSWNRFLKKSTAAGKPWPPK